ncbi:hypothetical protein DVP82_01610 [Yersinia enterocolitica]|nr:hypothetical protein [Yersinia enterocolitica]EKN5068791.1 hypothetical protein [Yersinia enterocolitica]EKN5120467.1 hypothetical protein [Yersinia enterocolitica]EKN5124336.1 hypothetical protein [Yersinia enterocolitica]EKN5131930.1 hypothetical protein [Yersinia enterocolitica]
MTSSCLIRLKRPNRLKYQQEKWLVFINTTGYSTLLTTILGILTTIIRASCRARKWLKTQRANQHAWAQCQRQLT